MLVSYLKIFSTFWPEHPDVLQAMPDVRYSLDGDNNINTNN
jgi:hypothetical protein